jgi:hypothetical protein
VVAWSAVISSPSACSTRRISSMTGVPLSPPAVLISLRITWPLAEGNQTAL